MITEAKYIVTKTLDANGDEIEIQTVTAIINGQEWSGITEASRFWADIQAWEAEGNTIEPYEAPGVESDAVNAERDRRIAENFIFTGKPFDFDPASKQRVNGAATLAGFAIAQGAQAGNLRWHGGTTDFAWIAKDNSLMAMDAQTCFAFGRAAAAHESDMIFKARAVKRMNPIPADYTDDKYWA
jgi:hypothetical protein